MAAPLNCKCVLVSSLCQRSSCLSLFNLKSSQINRRCLTSEDIATSNKVQKEFRKLQVRKIEKRDRRFTTKVQFVQKDNRFHDNVPPRSLKMKVDQDWPAVWPAAKTFNPSVIPLPIRQGAIKVPSEAQGDGMPPTKYANLELMKIPNFFHLTKKHVKQHCEAMKKYCTPWPEELKSPKDIHYHFPVTFTMRDYCFSSSSIRDDRARVVTMKLLLKSLELDKHAKDKLIKLLGDKYDPKQKLITLEADRCPKKSQNYHYIKYLLTALYFESWKMEAWESDMAREDYAEYQWDMGQSKKNILNLLNTFKETDKATEDGSEDRLAYIDDLPDTVTDSNVKDIPVVNQYVASVEKLFDKGESPQSINDYKKNVLKLLGVNHPLTSTDPSPTPPEPSVDSSSSVTGTV